MNQTVKTALYALVLLSLPFAAAIGGAVIGERSNARAEAQLEEMLQLVGRAPAPAAYDAVAPFDLAQASGDELRGRPLNAPREEPDPDSIPRGSPIDESDLPEGVPPGTEQIRVIPDESWDLIEKLEGGSGIAEDGKLVFEKTADGRYTKVTFSALGSFDYELPNPADIRNSSDPTKPPVEQIPGAIKSLDGEPVVVVGFMVPIEIDRQGQVKSFALTQNQAFCCYGVPPAMNEWIMVEMEGGKTAPFKLDLPVATYGSIEVGEEIEDGYILSIYRMTGGEVVDAHELLRRARG